MIIFFGYKTKFAFRKKVLFKKKVHVIKKICSEYYLKTLANVFWLLENNHWEDPVRYIKSKV